MKKIFIFIFGFCFFSTLASAQMMVEQGKVFMNLNAGDSASGEISFHNTSDQELHVSAYWQDFEYQEPFDGAKEFLPKGLSAYSAADAITFSPSEFTLAPYGKKQISYVIRTPEVFDRGLYGVLFFENAPKNAIVEGKGVSLVTRVGSLFFIEPTTKKKTAVINNITANADALNGQLTNQGKTILIARAIYYVMTQDGMVADRGELENLYLPPDKTADFSIAINSLNSGTYSLILTMDLQEGDSVVKEIDFSKSGSNINIIKVSN